jgi:hypothetical protein
MAAPEVPPVAVSAGLRQASTARVDCALKRATRAVIAIVVGGTVLTVEIAVSRNPFGGAEEADLVYQFTRTAQQRPDRRATAGLIGNHARLDAPGWQVISAVADVYRVGLTR